MDGSKLQSNHFERSAPEDYAEWLSKVPWKLYGTFTFAWKVSDQQADKIFHAFINRMEKHLRCDIVWVRGDEKRWSGCGKPSIPRHYHALFWSAALLHPWVFASEWMSMAGERGDGQGAKVDPYDPERNAIAYALKLINAPDGDWHFGKLDLAMPALASEPLTHRRRRRLRRHNDRVAALRGTDGRAETRS